MLLLGPKFQLTSNSKCSTQNFNQNAAGWNFLKILFLVSSTIIVFNIFTKTVYLSYSLSIMFHKLWTIIYGPKENFVVGLGFWSDLKYYRELAKNAILCKSEIPWKIQSTSVLGFDALATHWSLVSTPSITSITSSSASLAKIIINANYQYSHHPL